MATSTKIKGSFAWRSILKAKDLIQSGLSWRVGDGTKIPIKGSNWLLDEGHRRVLSPLISVPHDARVAELIHGSPPTWNVNKVQNLFLPYDAEAILKIPLSRRCQEDKLFWFTTRDGKYSVRSGYKLLLQESRASQPESSWQWDPDPLWKKIWRARVPVKIRSFLWRACHESLPTKLGLYKRKVTPTPLCDLCRDHYKDGLHALWQCPIVNQTWVSAPDFSALRTSSPASFSELACKVIHLNSDLLLEKFAVTCWLLWHKRNQDRLKLPSEDYTQIWNRAQASLHEYLAVTSEEKIEKSKPPQVRWKPPHTNYYKVNFDGAIFKESNEGGIGVVIRDNAGMVIATLSQKIRGPQTVEMVEAFAARRAIVFAKEVGIDDVEFEGDAVNVIRDLNSQVSIPTPYGLIIEDAKAILHDLQRSSLSHTRRSGNSVAHALARRAYHYNSPLIWMEEVPPDITNVLLNDFLAIN